MCGVTDRIDGGAHRVAQMVLIARRSCVRRSLFWQKMDSAKWMWDVGVL